MPTVTLDDLEVNYETSGQGEPLLFISGLGGNRASWALVTPRFQDRQCIVFDNRGTGSGALPPGPYTIPQMADDTAALIRHLGIGSVDIVGVSMGASVLQAFAYMHPDLLKRAVFISAFPSYTPVQHAWLDCLIALRDAGVDEVSAAIMGMPWVMTARTLYDHYAMAKAAELAMQMATRATPEGFKAQAAGLRVFDSRPNLHRVTARSLVLVGAEDVLTPPSQSIEIASLIPNATLRILPRGSHGVIAEYTDDVATAVKAFLDGDGPGAK